MKDMGTEKIFFSYSNTLVKEGNNKEWVTPKAEPAFHEACKVFGEVNCVVFSSIFQD